MKRNTKYDFSPSFIEGPLRRQRSASRHHWSFYVAIAIAIVAGAGILALQFIPSGTSAQEPVVMKDGKGVPLSSFCKQAVLDHDSYGRDLSDSLREYCGI